MTAIPGVSDRMLARRLRELENEDIVTRTVYPEVPPRVEYQLTTKGVDLEPVIREMERWGSRWTRKSTSSAVSRKPSERTTESPQER